MTRSVRVLLAPPFPPEATRRTHVVVVDVLRATTTIATALTNGAAGVIPVLTSEDALPIARRLGRDRILLCGERDAVLIPGFDLDNSPASYRAESVAGKTLIFTTTNGTRAFRATASAASVRAAALVNRTAVAEALLAESGDIAILCAGTQDRFAFEDALGAGALADALLRDDAELELDDASRAAALLYRSVEDRLADAVASSDHALELARKGFAEDLTRCAALDTLRIVPTLRDGVLVDETRAQATGAGGGMQSDGTGDATAALAARLESDLSGFRERHGSEYLVRGGVNAALLTGALHAYVSIAFRERRGDEALRAIAAAFEHVVASHGTSGGAIVETFLEGVAEWPWAWREELRRTLGPEGKRVLSTIGGDATTPAL
jgi:2-phosphosulfolactate phosphatase